jgi:hypothetical protein
MQGSGIDHCTYLPVEWEGRCGRWHFLVCPPPHLRDVHGPVRRYLRGVRCSYLISFFGDSGHYCFEHNSSGHKQWLHECNVPRMNEHNTFVVNNCRFRVFMNFVVDCTIDYNFDMACTASTSSNARCDQASVRQVGTGCQHLCCENCNSAV